MMSGTPYVYQGEEFAMTNKHFADISEFDDLMAHFHYQKMLERGVEPKAALDFLNFFSRDHARVPVQWNDSHNAGFTSGTPWLAVNENYKEINAEASVLDSDSVFNHYRKLIALRQGEEYGDVIVYGRHQLLDANDSDVYAYQRVYQGKTLLIVANFSGEIQQRSYSGKVIKTALSNYSQEIHSLENMQLQPYQASIIEIS